MSTDAKRPAPVWDRGDPIDEEMMRFTVGDDWAADRRLVEVDLLGSIAHANGLLRADLIVADDHARIVAGLRELADEHARGLWDLEATDEDVHSAVERRLTDKIGEAGLRLHTGRSRNDQVAVDLRLWLRTALATTDAAAARLVQACDALAERAGDLPLPGYTHLRRAMPSSIGAWIGALRAAFEADRADLAHVSSRLRFSPLGSGAGYGVPLALDRDGVARELGFEGAEEPVTLAQNARGRAELAYVSALEGFALDLGKLAFDLWLFSSAEFAFVELPVELTTGSSLMPHKRNPDVIELLRARTRQIAADRASLLDVVRDLPSGYHRDFQLGKAPLFRAHDHAGACLSITAKLLDGLRLRADVLQAAAADPALAATARLLEQARAGEPFRAAYKNASRKS